MNNSVLNVKRYQGVVFDLFHTLSTLQHTKAPGKHSSELLGIVRQTWNEALFSKTDDRLRGKIKNPLAVISSIVEQIDLDFTVSNILLQEIADSRIRRFDHALKHPLPHILTTLKALKECGLKIGLVSNADFLEMPSFYTSPMNTYFDSVNFSCECGIVKPEKGIFLKCLQELKLNAEDCLYIGDGGNSELEVAKELGFSTVFTSEFIVDMWPDKIPSFHLLADFHITCINQLIYNL